MKQLEWPDGRVAVKRCGGVLHPAYEFDREIADSVVARLDELVTARTTSIRCSPDLAHMVTDGSVYGGIIQRRYGHDWDCDPALPPNSIIVEEGP